MDRRLVLVRHGQSEGNLKNIFTGWRDLALTEQGIAEASGVAQRLQALDVRFDIGFTSRLRRAWQSCSIILENMGQADVRQCRNAALNERDYGDLTGLNKDEARTRWGDDLQKILPAVMRGDRTLVVAHGNSLRSLVMVLDRLSPESVTSVEFATGDIHLYRLAADTTVAQRQVSLASGEI
ncbi:2,3-bisphosphoglycerate-dependent phosphoglycerate mutase [Nitrobacter sp.]|uniref:2,3-bisphosphoglycerate-dependent phosphoglycerate mutase n=1 Tax=Nitrobacter sp. TaxID=29420 RepID=UPI001ACAEDEA|nr:2,3-bisphosphoglycerate-dependent phosphoglycerate mutase [Nitrobacter sp.]MBN9149667.1 2,3-bisphosphoglycerate-dependent phosphoglycerate mutase [Nitrobacter sp.]